MRKVKMRGAAGLLVLLLAMSAGICAEDVIEAERGEAERADWEWITVRTEGNRFVVNGLDPAATQGVALWMDQTFRRLVREFGIRAAFDPFQPLVVVLHPEIDGVSLHQQGQRRRLAQEIRAPEGDGFDGLRFAEVFLEAILYRFWDQRREQGDPMPAVPEWLVRGWAAEFIPEARGPLSGQGIALWRDGALNPPYTLTENSSGNGGGALVDTVWMVSFLFSEVRDRERIWVTLQREGVLSAAWWREALGAGSLREVHLVWEMWMADRARRFLTDPSAGDLFRAQVARELRFSPGRYGLDGDVPRDEWFTLPELADRLDAHWVPALIQAWRSRMSVLRVGQRAERLQQMDLYVKAAEALLAAGELRGDRRAEALDRFRRLYDMAGEMGR